MFDPKKLLNDLLGSQSSRHRSSTVRDGAGKATQMAKDNPLAAGALVAVLLGTGAGRRSPARRLKLGGLAAIGGLAYKAYQNYQDGKQPAETPDASRNCCRRPPTPVSTPPKRRKARPNSR